jgi:tetratricopeptide (TPR) repeat protein
MEIKNWAVLVFSLILFVLIFSFLRTIFRTEKKQFSHDRIYVDYATYKRPTAANKADGYHRVIRSPHFYEQVSLGRQYVHAGRGEMAARLFEQGMAENFKDAPPFNEPKPAQSADYQKYLEMGNLDIEEINLGRSWFARKNYRQAVSDFQQALTRIDPADLQHLMQVYEMMAESHFHLKDKERYVEFKEKRIQTLRKIRELTKRTFPTQQTDESPDWISSEEATQQLLRIRTFAASKLEGPERDMVIRRAEFDLEVARRVSN